MEPGPYEPPLEPEEPAVDLTIVQAVIYLIIACAFLIAIFFLIRAGEWYVVMAFNVLFAIGSTLALHSVVMKHVVRRAAYKFHPDCIRERCVCVRPVLCFFLLFSPCVCGDDDDGARSEGGVCGMVDVRVPRMRMRRGGVWASLACVFWLFYCYFIGFLLLFVGLL